MREHGISKADRPLRHRAWLAAATAAALVLGCGGPPADPVDALLQELEAAAEDRDAERFSARLAAEFRGSGAQTRADAVSTLRRYFAAYESVGVAVHGVEVDRIGSVATIRCVVEFAGEVRSVSGLRGLLPPSAVYRFTLEAGEGADSSAAWKVRSATWEPVGLDEGP